MNTKRHISYTIAYTLTGNETYTASFRASDSGEALAKAQRWEPKAKNLRVVGESPIDD